MFKRPARDTQITCGIDSNGFGMAMLLVIFVLLVIFMTSQPMIQYGVSVDIPRAEHPRAAERALREDALVVGITRDGKRYLQSTPVDATELGAKIHAQLMEGAPWEVYLKADRNAKYGAVLQALNQVRAAGLGKVCFLVEERRKTVQ